MRPSIVLDLSLLADLRDLFECFVAEPLGQIATPDGLSQFDLAGQIVRLLLLPANLLVG